MRRGRKPGTPKTGGRKKGTINKVAGYVKEAQKAASLVVEPTAIEIGQRALRVIEEIMNNAKAPFACRLTAAIHLSERAFGKAKQALDVSMVKPVYVISDRPLTADEWATHYADTDSVDTAGRPPGSADQVPAA
jgi:hypothetical protein